VFKKFLLKTASQGGFMVKI